MAITAELTGVYIADIITTATITIIVATIITITAIGRDLSGNSRQQTSSPQGKGRSTRCGPFPFCDPGPITKARITRSRSATNHVPTSCRFVSCVAAHPARGQARVLIDA